MEPDVKNMTTEEVIELYKIAQEFLGFIEKEVKACEESEKK